ncbi:hypothetical protein LF41_922 [Lysobacter dokdonensis DS-58]|uniref:Uncharacterized protein n=1 Tax=Lysobacter dokdonensis DS-58 TaxID=1300345 RepID=A0A0A2WQ08_9GAMM|nr:hypothetical protein [Lysobacter dokdonensis]KGQ20385.1 hypothetical protein LF41_922 [Lysobacter dokdonensis DS-58]
MQIAYFIRLMAHLTESGTPASVQNARLAPDAIGWCFANLSKEMDAVMSTIQFASSAPTDNTVDRAASRPKQQRACAN